MPSFIQQFPSAEMQLQKAPGFWDIHSHPNNPVKDTVGRKAEFNHKLYKDIKLQGKQIQLTAEKQHPPWGDWSKTPFIT